MAKIARNGYQVLHTKCITVEDSSDAPAPKLLKIKDLEFGDVFRKGGEDWMIIDEEDFQNDELACDCEVEVRKVRDSDGTFQMWDKNECTFPREDVVDFVYSDMRVVLHR